MNGTQMGDGGAKKRSMTHPSKASLFSSPPSLLVSRVDLVLSSLQNGVGDHPLDFLFVPDDVLLGGSDKVNLIHDRRFQSRQFLLQRLQLCVGDVLLLKM